MYENVCIRTQCMCTCTTLAFFQLYCVTVATCTTVLWYSTCVHVLVFQSEIEIGEFQIGPLNFVGL